MPQSLAPSSPSTSSAGSPPADAMTSAVAPRAPADLGLREVIYAKQDGVARITLNRPAALQRLLDRGAGGAGHRVPRRHLRRRGRRDRLHRRRRPGLLHRRRREGVRHGLRPQAARLLEVHGAVPGLHREHPQHRQAGGRPDQRDGGGRRQREPARLRPERHGAARLPQAGGDARRLGGLRRRDAVAAAHRRRQARPRDADAQRADPGAQGARVGAGELGGAVGAARRTSGSRRPRADRSARRSAARTATVSTSAGWTPSWPTSPGSCSPRSPSASATPNSRPTSSRTSSGTRRCGTPRTGWRCTTPAGSRSRGCRRSWRSERRAMPCCASGRHGVSRPRRRGGRRCCPAGSAGRRRSPPATAFAGNAAHRSRNGRRERHRPRHRRGPGGRRLGRRRSTSPFPTGRERRSVKTPWT